MQLESFLAGLSCLVSSSSSSLRVSSSQFGILFVLTATHSSQVAPFFAGSSRLVSSALLFFTAGLFLTGRNRVLFHDESLFAGRALLRRSESFSLKRMFLCHGESLPHTSETSLCLAGLNRFLFSQRVFLRRSSPSSQVGFV